MNITEMKLADIKPYEKNQKKHPETQVKNIATSIEKYGFVQPLVLSKDNEIIIGHGRFLAAQSIGMENVPCVYADNLSEEQIRELRILDNKLNESEWDMDLLKTDLIDLSFSDFDIDFGISFDEPAEDEERKGIVLNESISVVIDCGDESEAERIFNELKEGGYACRISTL